MFGIAIGRGAPEPKKKTIIARKSVRKHDQNKRLVISCRTARPQPRPPKQRRENTIPSRLVVWTAMDMDMDMDMISERVIGPRPRNTTCSVCHGRCKFLMRYMYTV